MWTSCQVSSVKSPKTKPASFSSLAKQRCHRWRLKSSKCFQKFFHRQTAGTLTTVHVHSKSIASYLTTSFTQSCPKGIQSSWTLSQILSSPNNSISNVITRGFLNRLSKIRTLLLISISKLSKARSLKRSLSQLLRARNLSSLERERYQAP